MRIDCSEISTTPLRLCDEFGQIGGTDSEFIRRRRCLNDPVDRIFEVALVLRQGNGEWLGGEGFIKKRRTCHPGLVADQAGAVGGNRADLTVDEGLHEGVGVGVFAEGGDDALGGEEAECIEASR